ncbi:Wzz/FepE/Etk N-terminal domain-containing protein [Glutamicibacter protophormiae]|uniref:Wzz/FepE/Etk N-terminal domain-containing protein n=1 Tax=Glutamicibacter protophormiae TaxID=37930 RepID=UPI0019598E16|nr:Wzz/FepE/Etk N-terminal domain-containing protein [Glutamicibacter protophormiae]QRQ79989.1 hypothetical protein JQN66_07225 [Glutamicibacter protophormiae]
MTRSLDFTERNVYPGPQDREFLMNAPASGGSGGAHGMDLKDYVGVLKNRWIWIVIATTLGVVASLAITMAMTPKYTAKATLFVTVQSSQDTAYARSQYAMQRVGSYPQLISDPAILNGVIKELDLDLSMQDLKESLTAANPVDTVLINVTGSANTAERAADIANAAAPLLAEQISALENTDPEKLLVTPELSVPATEPVSPVAPRKTVNLALGFIAGLSLGIVLALIIDKLDPRVIRAKDAERRTNLPVLGKVFTARGKSGNGRNRNDYRQLVSSLLMANDAHLPQRILILSDPKAPTIDAIELASTLAAIGKKALVVQGDTRMPPLDTAESTSVGLGQVFLRTVTLQQAVQNKPEVPMGYLPAGSEEVELRGYDVFRQMEPMIADLESGHDVVIMLTTMQSTPVDGAAVAIHCDCVLVTCQEKKTTFGHLKRVINDLSSVRVGATGLIVLRKSRRFARPRKG